MRILIAGASGFIGGELTKILSEKHHLTVIGRDIKRLEQIFQKTIDKIIWDNLDNYDARKFDIIINLAGANISAKRWDKAVKKELIESRTSSNRQLINWLIKQKAYPHYYCANAVGIYGGKENDTKLFNEDSPVYCAKTKDFLKQIGLAWEESLNSAVEQGIKVTTLRFGVVLKKSKGMLKKLEWPFSLGFGTILGSGNQVISWVHHQDLDNAILFLLNHPSITGPVNITSPNPISQKEFATQLARTLKRPIFLKMPAFMIKLLFGEMGEYLLLKGQKVFPDRLIKLGFKFTYSNLADALKHEYQ